MNYIILDLEWNQASDSKDQRSRMLPFEIIEIGAVKLNSRMEICGTFHELIKPQVYLEMHRVTQELIHLDMEELEQGRRFPEVAAAFLAWCGKDYMFGTWGPLDLSELQRNLRFFGMDPIARGPFRFYDVQKLFSIAFEDAKSRRNLEYAVDFLGIDKDIPFHRALSDACYTARVLERIKDPEVLQMYSYDTFWLPGSRKEEIHAVFPGYAKFISRPYEEKALLFADKEVVATKCYLCHCNLKKKIRWFTANGKHYYSLSYCQKHGYMKGKIRVRKSEDEMVYAVKTTRMIGEEEVKELYERREKARELRRQKRHKTSEGV